jgi:hypothetical protein
VDRVKLVTAPPYCAVLAAAPQQPLRDIAGRGMI